MILALCSASCAGRQITVTGGAETTLVMFERPVTDGRVIAGGNKGYPVNLTQAESILPARTRSPGPHSAAKWLLV